VKNSETRKEIFSYLLESVLKVFEGEVICFLIHGSIVKGGLIEGFSDLDVQVFLKESSFDEFGLKLERCMEIQKLIGNLNLTKIGAQYLQMYFHNPKEMPDWYTPPFKGSFKILHGKLPEELDFNAENFRNRMIKSLKELRIEVKNTISNFADSSNKTVYRRTRLLATKIYPIMYSLLSYDLLNPIEIWTKPKFEVLELFRQKYQKKIITNYLTKFFTKIELLAIDRSNLKLMKEAFSNGVNFLKEAAIIGEGIDI
jgi:predicted nucleotidyltransferase